MSIILSVTPPTASTHWSEVADPHLFQRPRTWWFLLALFLMADGGGLFSIQTSHPGAGNIGRYAGGVDQSSESIQFLAAAMWVLCFGLIVRHIRPVLRLIQREKMVLAFPVLAFVSALWSQVPSVSYHKAILLFLYVLFAAFFVTYYRPVEQMRLLLALGTIMGVWSVVWGVLLPKYGVHGTGEWKGIFGQKNMLGTSMFFLFSGLPFIPFSNGRAFRNILLQAILPLVLILLSNSQTSLIMVFLIVVVRIVGPLLIHTRREAKPFLFVVLGAGAAIVPLMMGVVLPLLGRDLTFSGRSHYWGLLIPLAFKRPWLGYGFQAFFIGPSGEPGPIHFGTGTGNIFSSDNGYLDVLLQCGMVGVCFVLALLVKAAWEFLVLIRQNYVPLVAFWYSGMIVAIFLGSVTDNMLWKPVRMVPFILAFVCMGLGNLRYQIASESRTPAGVKAAS